MASYCDVCRGMYYTPHPHVIVQRRSVSCPQGLPPRHTSPHRADFLSERPAMNFASRSRSPPSCGLTSSTFTHTHTNPRADTSLPRERGRRGRRYVCPCGHRSHSQPVGGAGVAPSSRLSSPWWSLETGPQKPQHMQRYPSPLAPPLTSTTPPLPTDQFDRDGLEYEAEGGECGGRQGHRYRAETFSSLQHAEAVDPPFDYLRRGEGIVSSRQPSGPPSRTSSPSRWSPLSPASFFFGDTYPHRRQEETAYCYVTPHPVAGRGNKWAGEDAAAAEPLVPRRGVETNPLPTHADEIYERHGAPSQDRRHESAAHDHHRRRPSSRSHSRDCRADHHHLSPFPNDHISGSRQPSAPHSPVVHASLSAAPHTKSSPPHAQPRADSAPAERHPKHVTALSEQPSRHNGEEARCAHRPDSVRKPAPHGSRHASPSEPRGTLSPSKAADCAAAARTRSPPSTLSSLGGLIAKIRAEVSKEATALRALERKVNADDAAVAGREKKRTPAKRAATHLLPRAERTTQPTVTTLSTSAPSSIEADEDGTDDASIEEAIQRADERRRVAEHVSSATPHNAQTANAANNHKKKPAQAPKSKAASQGSSQGKEADTHHRQRYHTRSLSAGDRKAGDAVHASAPRSRAAASTSRRTSSTDTSPSEASLAQSESSVGSSEQQLHHAVAEAEAILKRMRRRAESRQRETNSAAVPRSTHSRQNRERQRAVEEEEEAPDTPHLPEKLQNASKREEKRTLSASQRASRAAIDTTTEKKTSHNQRNASEKRDVTPRQDSSPLLPPSPAQVTATAFHALAADLEAQLHQQQQSWCATQDHRIERLRDGLASLCSAVRKDLRKMREEVGDVRATAANVAAAAAAAAPVSQESPSSADGARRAAEAMTPQSVVAWLSRCSDADQRRLAELLLPHLRPALADVIAEEVQQQLRAQRTEQQQQLRDAEARLRAYTDEAIVSAQVRSTADVDGGGSSGFLRAADAGAPLWAGFTSMDAFNAHMRATARAVLLEEDDRRYSLANENERRHEMRVRELQQHWQTTLSAAQRAWKSEWRSMLEQAEGEWVHTAQAPLQRQTDLLQDIVKALTLDVTHLQDQQTRHAAHLQSSLQREREMRQRESAATTEHVVEKVLRRLPREVESACVHYHVQRERAAAATATTTATATAGTRSTTAVLSRVDAALPTTEELRLSVVQPALDHMRRLLASHQEMMATAVEDRCRRAESAVEGNRHVWAQNVTELRGKVSALRTDVRGAFNELCDNLNVASPAL